MVFMVGIFLSGLMIGLFGCRFYYDRMSEDVSEARKRGDLLIILLWTLNLVLNYSALTIK